MGQSSVRAALIYQHSTLTRQREIADRLDVRVRSERGEPRHDRGDGQSGTDLARDA
jgi:hypothetical protein